MLRTLVWRTALAVLPGVLSAQQRAIQPDTSRSLNAERLIAMQELQAGHPLTALTHLERARTLMDGLGRADAKVLGPLALVYAQLGQTDAFVLTADRALRAGATGAEAEAIRGRLARLRAEQGEPAGESAARAPAESEAMVLADAWQAYRGGQLDAAARAFGRLASQAASPLRRDAARLMLGQVHLEAGRPDSAHRWFVMARDSARGQSAAVDSTFDRAVFEPARAIVRARAFEMLHGDAASLGQLLLAEPDTARGLAGPPPLRVLSNADLAAREGALGRPMSVAGVRAVLRLPFTAEGSARLRALAIALREADARVARAQEALEQARLEQRSRRAAAEQLILYVQGMRDSLRLTESWLRALSDSLVHRDSSIARTVRQYRVTLLGKIADVRDLASANARRVDSLVSAARAMPPAALQVARDEMTTAASYRQIASAAEAALDSGLVRQPVLVRRDSLHQRLDALSRALALEWTRQDSARVAALALRDGVAAAWTAREQGLLALRAAQAATRDSVESVAAAVVTGELRERARRWRVTLARDLEAAEFGEATARFFSVMASAATAVTARDQAIVALTAVADRYPQSALRPRAVLHLAELLARLADADYATAQRAGTNMDRPDYAAAIARLDEFLRLYPADPEADAAAYTVGSLNFTAQRWDEAARAWDRVIADPKSRFRSEAFYRQGETRFEQAIRLAGDARRALLAQASAAYEQAINLSPRDGDIYYLAMYKLGWSSYVQAERQASEEYRRAVDVFARLVAEYDRLAPERQARLALRQEAIDYMAIALTQIGGANDAIQYLSSLPDMQTRLLVLRRTARALREQGEFASAALAFRAVADQAPLDTLALNAQVELVDLYQNRMLEQERAQQARLHLVETYGPDTPWGRANAKHATETAVVREHMLRDAAQYELAKAPKSGRAVFASAAELLARYQREFAGADSAPNMLALYAEALFGAGEFAKAGAEYSRAALRGDTTMAAAARRNAIVALDSAFARSPADRAVQDSLFAASDRFVARASDADARQVMISKGRRAAEAGRWEVVAQSFDAFATRWPADPFATDARKLVGDARFKLGQYREAQAEWGRAQRAAADAGRRTLVDSIAGARIGAAARVADSLVKAGEYARTADEVFVPLAQDIGDPVRAGDALRNAIEIQLAADSTLRLKGDAAGALAAKRRAADLIVLLAREYPAYQHTFTYRTVRARLLSDVGDGTGAVAALRELTASNATWPGRADAMVRTAVLLDSLGRRAEAAAAYEQVSATYPTDRRAADAAYNAAVTYGDARDPANAARMFASFAQRFPRDARVPEAQRSRLDQLMLAGDSTTAASELARLCVRPTSAFADRCAARAAEAAYRDGMALWPRYEAMQLIITTRAELTRAGVEKAAAPKQQLLRQLGQVFGRAIATGAPLWLSAASFQTGLAQWHYGLFLRDVKLPAELTEGQRTAAQRGSAQQAQQYFDAARATWQALLDKAAAGGFDNAWVARAKDALEGKGVPPRELPPAPAVPQPAADSGKPVVPPR
ncbi:MAG TPA: tetratricopeptide repeat protein [Gemmatimonadaceae bacterium]|jgi:TolA-binding protein